MAKTSYTLTDQDAGTVLPIKDGFVTDLKMVRAPTVLNPMPRIGARFGLRDDRQDVSPGLRNVISYDPLNWGNPNGSIWLGASAGYTGALKVISVPKGAGLCHHAVGSARPQTQGGVIEPGTIFHFPA